MAGRVCWGWGEGGICWLGGGILGDVCGLGDVVDRSIEEGGGEALRVDIT